MPAFYDRYTGKWTTPDSFPADIDLGRYTAENGADLTNRVFQVGNNRFIHQDLLEEGNESIHNDFLQIKDKELVQKDSFVIYPTVQCIEKELGLYDFEKYLCEKVRHIEEICRQPHSLLQRTIEKVNVARAKRIPSKSYQYLASHTEDWEQKSILLFKPNRILHEELDVNYNVYENQLTLALVNRCLRHLEGRLRRIKSLRQVLESYESLSGLLEGKVMENAWYEKLHRNLTLIAGSMTAYQESFLKTLSKTEESLRGAYKTLLKCKTSPLFDEVDARVTQGITLRDTNVLVNHKHYRYVRYLWVELQRFRPEKDEEKRKADEQDVLDGLRSYGKVLLAYTVLNMSVRTQCNYHLAGRYSDWTARHPRKAEIILSENKDKTLSVRIGKYELRFIIIGNPPQNTSMLPDRTFLLYYGKDDLPETERAIRIDPVDADSSERVGKLINKYLLAGYADGIREKFPFPMHLRNYIKYIDAPWVAFDIKSSTYSFKKPGTKLQRSSISSELTVGKNIRDDQMKDLMKLIRELNEQYNHYIAKRLFCFHCLEPYNVYTLETFDYLRCGDDDFIVDLSKADLVIVKSGDEKYEGKDIDWGMDCLEINTKL